MMISEGDSDSNARIDMNERDVSRVLGCQLKLGINWGFFIVVLLDRNHHILQRRMEEKMQQYQMNCHQTQSHQKLKGVHCRNLNELQKQLHKVQVEVIVEKAERNDIPNIDKEKLLPNFQWISSSLSNGCPPCCTLQVREESKPFGHTALVEVNS